MTSRREAVRINVFARASLIGGDRSVRCAVVNLSAAGAMLSLTASLPAQPLRLAIEFGGAQLELPVEVVRSGPGGGLAVAFPRPPSEALFRLIAVEQRYALAKGRVNISERRLPPSFRRRPDEPPVL
jgi:hypothetical protein